MFGAGIESGESAERGTAKGDLIGNLPEAGSREKAVGHLPWLGESHSKPPPAFAD